MSGPRLIDKPASSTSTNGLERAGVGGSSRGLLGGDALSSGWLTIALSVLVVFVLLRVGAVIENPALAEMVISDSGYTMMTTNGGPDEILVVVDSRQEVVLVYRVSQTGGIEMLDKELLSGVFSRARARAVGVP